MTAKLTRLERRYIHLALYVVLFAVSVGCLLSR
jgi:hypothetical protein